MPVLDLTPARLFLDRMLIAAVDLTTETDLQRTTQLLAERFDLTHDEAETVLGALIREAAA